MKDKFEVIEKSTGARMAHSQGYGEPMGSTLFNSKDSAEKWMAENQLSKTHKVVPATA